jgi:hypothetical protein
LKSLALLKGCVEVRAPEQARLAEALADVAKMPISDALDRWHPWIAPSDDRA